MVPMNLRTVGSPKGFTFRSSCRYHVSFATSATGNDHIDKNTAPDHEIWYDYGYRASTAAWVAEDKGWVPGTLLAVGTKNFRRELASLIGSRRAVTDTDPSAKAMRLELEKLRLSNDAVYRRDLKREADRAAAGNDVSIFIKGIYFALCVLLDVLYAEKPIAKFWVLETVARMPYFAYLSVLHLYESLGLWRQGSELQKLHFAEGWNELHHLMIMESLGGDERWFDRFVAGHAAVVYYWILVVTYMVSPKTSYQFSELVEGHATDTYTEFIGDNEAILRGLPPPKCAVDYYMGSEMFHMFQTEVKVPRKPRIETLYDVFENVRDDEIAHERTMIACQNPFPKE